MPSPKSVNVAPEGIAEVESTGIVLSASVADMPKLRLIPSVVDRAPIVAKSGAWLPDSVTVRETTSLSVRAPSVVKNVTE